MVKIINVNLALCITIDPFERFPETELLSVPSDRYQVPYAAIFFGYKTNDGALYVGRIYGPDKGNRLKEIMIQIINCVDNFVIQARTDFHSISVAKAGKYLCRSTTGLTWCISRMYEKDVIHVET